MRLRHVLALSRNHFPGPRQLGALLAVTAASAGAVTAAAMPASASPAVPRATARASAASPGTLSQPQAAALARQSGKPVQVTGATTPVSTLTANPDGTFTVTENAVPVRKRIAGKWEALDATLRRNADGTLSPSVSTDPLRLSGGGTGPLATMTALGHTLSVTFPARLPAPALSGGTATYASVYPGVDLVLTADAQGTFDYVLVVKDAAAAANPALARIGMRMAASGGLTFRHDASGEVDAVTSTGKAVFTQPAPVMWDSRAAASTVKTFTAQGTGQRIDLRTGNPVASSAATAGEAARTAKIATSYRNGILTYTPAASLLAGKATAYPVYIDPWFPAPGPATQYWAEVNDINGGVTDPRLNPLQAGYNGWEAPYFTSHSFITMTMPSEIDNAHTQIGLATLTLMDTYAPACYNSTTSGDGDWGTQVWRTKTVTSSSLPTWSSQNASGFWVTQEGPTRYFGHGHDSSCGPASQGFDVSEAATTAAHSSLSAVTFGIRADDENTSDSSAPYGWKKFDPTQTSLTITYDRPPTVSDLSTSPSTSCSANEVVGLGDVMLYAKVGSPVSQVGSNLVPTFSASETSGNKTAIPNLNPTGSAIKGYTNGSIVSARIPQSEFTGPTSNGGLGLTAATEFTWNVTVADGGTSQTAPNLTASATCHFTYDPTKPGAPVFPTASEPTAMTIGTSYTFTVDPPACATASPPTCTVSGYNWQLNYGDSHHVDATGEIKIPLTPTSWDNTLTVTAESAGGNAGQTGAYQFNAKIGSPQPDGDLTGDGVPDLVSVGGTGTGLPAGLWLAGQQAAAGGGAGDGKLTGAITDIGEYGNGAGPIGGTQDNSPADFNGAQVITGDFTPDTGLQDPLVYYPAHTVSGTSYPGQGFLLNGQGDGTLIDARDSSNSSSVSNTMLDDPNNDTPLQIANGYNAAGSGNGYPDLIGISGDSTSGYYLGYYPSDAGDGNWAGSSAFIQLALPTPDGSPWNDWRITTMPDATGPGTDLFLFKYQAAGSLLYECPNFQVTDQAPAEFGGTGASNCTTTNASGTTVSSATEITPATSNTWQPVTSGAPVQLRAASINGTGPALWAVSATGQAQAWTLTEISTAGTSPLASQSLLSPTHNWRIGDMPAGDDTGDPVTTTADTGLGSPLNLTAAGNVTWNNDKDLFTPAASFNSGGTVNGYLSETTSGPANDDGNYTISAWVKPATLGGAILSQAGASTSCYMLYIDTTTISGTTYGRWNFRQSNADTSTPTWTTATTADTNYVKLGTWTHLTITYDSATKYLRLYDNGVPAATVSMGTTWAGGCETFSLGRYIDGGGVTHGLFQGEIADVQEWNGNTMNPTQVATTSGNHGITLFSSDGTSYASAASATAWQWTSRCSDAGFYHATLTIHMTCATGPNTTFGPGGTTTGSTLTFQGDGNLVIRNGSGTAVWASGTSNNPDDVMLLQPDGNLVIYGPYGQTLWSANTQNAQFDS